MLYRRLLGKLRDDSGVNYNGTNELEKVLYITKFSKEELEEMSRENLEEILENLFSISNTFKEDLNFESRNSDVFSLYSNLKNYMSITKNLIRYKSFEEVIKIKSFALKAKEFFNSITKEDIISLIVTINKILDIENAITIDNKNNDIRFEDIDNITLSEISLKSDNDVKVSTPSYLRFKIHNDVKFVTTLAAKNATSKLVKKLNK